MMAFTSPMLLSVKVAICSGVYNFTKNTLLSTGFGICKVLDVMEYPALFIGLHRLQNNLKIVKYKNGNI